MCEPEQVAWRKGGYSCDDQPSALPSLHTMECFVGKCRLPSRWGHNAGGVCLESPTLREVQRWRADGSGPLSAGAYERQRRNFRARTGQGKLGRISTNCLGLDSEINLCISRLAFLVFILLRPSGRLG